LSELAPEDFVELLPLLRRAFSGFTSPERRNMGEKVRHLRSTPLSGAPVGDHSGSTADLDHERASLVLPVLAQILGVKFDAN
jgi:hypothetical protein